MYSVMKDVLINTTRTQRALYSAGVRDMAREIGSADPFMAKATARDAAEQIARYEARPKDVRRRGVRGLGKEALAAAALTTVGVGGTVLLGEAIDNSTVYTQGENEDTVRKGGGDLHPNPSEEVITVEGEQRKGGGE